MFLLFISHSHFRRARDIESQMCSCFSRVFMRVYKTFENVRTDFHEICNWGIV
jgi:hypothetical protein